MCGCALPLSVLKEYILYWLTKTQDIDFQDAKADEYANCDVHRKMLYNKKVYNMGQIICEHMKAECKEK